MLQSDYIISNSNIAFGTSGARGLVADFSNDVCAAFTHAFLAVVHQSFSFDRIAIAIDNRPSSYSMAKACAAAAIQAGIEPVFYGVVPTPALAYQAMILNIPAIMVTGSHIPFDRNGLKFYRPDGEITKRDEQAILKAGIDFEILSDLPKLNISDDAKSAYLQRNKAFANPVFMGKRIGIYEHSSAGRDLYRELFEELGAEVVSLGRSDTFVPIDTEAVSKEDRVRAKEWVKEYDLDVLFSTDGDGDRPLLAGEDGEWLRGDVLGILCAQALGIEALAIPVSCNTAAELSCLFSKVIRTKIGSPYVIESFDELCNEFDSVAGYEANGGFLLATDISFQGHKLKALPTRDALLPILAVLSIAKTGLIPLLEELPCRFTASSRITNFDPDRSRRLLINAKKNPELFVEKLGFTSDSISCVNFTDGFRVQFKDLDIIHIRASGNAPELRCYAESRSNLRAEELVYECLEYCAMLNNESV